MSRTEYFMKNFIWLGISTVLSSVVTLITRTIFIKVLGDSLLGVNDLFYGIVSMLSLTELGIGPAITFCLYKPLAENDTEKIQALMRFYRNAYRFIAFVILVLGIALTPFLSYITEGETNLPNIYVVYFLFLINSVTSYLFTYKTTFLVAQQKKYLLTNIYMIISLITLIIQSIVLIVFKNYYIYLCVELIVNLSKNCFVNRYINKSYPHIFCKNDSKLSKSETKDIFSKIKAMLVYKLSEICISQTDDIIISIFINITTIGYKGNYYAIINFFKRFATGFLHSASAGLGNMVATENYEKRLKIFEAYSLLAFWLFGFMSIMFYYTLDRIIYLWLGPKYIDIYSVLLISVNFLIMGINLSQNVLKEAAGLFEEDRIVCVSQAVINLVISIIGAKYLGLCGIYLGTIISDIVPLIFRPIFIYNTVFNKKAFVYFKMLIKYMLYYGLYFVHMIFINRLFANMINNEIILLLAIVVYVLVTFNIYIILVYRNSEALQRLFGYVKGFLVK